MLLENVGPPSILICDYKVNRFKELMLKAVGGSDKLQFKLHKSCDSVKVNSYPY